MKVKTSVSLSAEVLTEMDRAAGGKINRSEFLERAAWNELESMKKGRREARDRRVIDRAAKSLNDEALDVLDFQTER